MTDLQVKILARNAQGSIKTQPEDLIRRLKTTPEKNFAKHFITSPKDVDYYLGLWQLSKKLPNRSKIAMQKAIGPEIDINNITWCYRLKKYFGYPPQNIFKYLVPISHRLPHSQLQQMIHAPNPSDIPTLAAPYYQLGDFGAADFEKRKANIIQQAYQKQDKSPLIYLCRHLL